MVKSVKPAFCSLMAMQRPLNPAPTIPTDTILSTGRVLKNQEKCSSATELQAGTTCLHHASQQNAKRVDLDDAMLQQQGHDSRNESQLPFVNHVCSESIPRTQRVCVASQLTWLHYCFKSIKRHKERIKTWPAHVSAVYMCMATQEHGHAQPLESPRSSNGPCRSINTPVHACHTLFTNSTAYPDHSRALAS
jgi:hypothetical protein